MVDQFHQDREESLTSDTWSSTDEAGVLIASPDNGLDELVEQLRSHDCEVQQVDSYETLETRAMEWRPEIVIVDDRLDGLGGAKVLDELKARTHCVCVLLVDTYSPKTLVWAVDLGADVFLERPVAPDELLRVVEQELRARQAHGAPTGSDAGTVELVGVSNQMHEVCRRVVLAAPSRAPVLITGESGTGKELVAGAIHRLSPRRTRPFVALNCGAIPENLLESELFGHEEGAFTGATSRREGRFEQADTGTLFLDEVGELPRNMQVKLLRILQEQRFERVGSSQTLSVDVRIIAASNIELGEAVSSGAFRSDLFYRLNVLQIALSPLRERKDDIAPLWGHFVRRTAAEEARAAPETTLDVTRMLLRYDWPGNVRELQNVAWHAVTMTTQDRITQTRLPAHFRRQLDRADDPAAPRLPGMTLAEIERAAIVQTYRAVDNVQQTAELLDVSERKIYYRLKEYRDQGYLADQPDEPIGDA